jgi:hypothetical protein
MPFVAEAPLMNLVVVAVALVGLVVGSLLGFSVWTAHRVEKAVAPAGTFIDVDGNRIHYVDRGNGPAIVMIHGLGATEKLRVLSVG